MLRNLKTLIELGITIRVNVIFAEVAYIMWVRLEDMALRI